MKLNYWLAILLIWVGLYIGVAVSMVGEISPELETTWLDAIRVFFYSMTPALIAFLAGRDSK